MCPHMHLKCQVVIRSNKKVHDFHLQKPNGTPFPSEKLQQELSDQIKTTQMVEETVQDVRGTGDIYLHLFLLFHFNVTPLSHEHFLPLTQKRSVM